MENRRVYSLNFLAYIEGATGRKFDIVPDENKKGIYYGIIPEDIDIGKYRKQYHTDEAMQNFIHSFRDIKKKIADRRTSRE